jgi:hypothetical protein
MIGYRLVAGVNHSALYRGSIIEEAKEQERQE